jgi:hypothetical protein
MSRSIGLAHPDDEDAAPADWSGRRGVPDRARRPVETPAPGPVALAVGGQGVAFRRVPFALRGCVVNTAAYPLGVRLTTLVQRRNRRVTLAPRV